MNSVEVAWDAWRAVREGRAGVARRERRRLAALVGHTRRHSRFSADRYRDLPPWPVDLRRLPQVKKPELVARFDE